MSSPSGCVFSRLGGQTLEKSELGNLCENVLNVVHVLVNGILADVLSNELDNGRLCNLCHLGSCLCGNFIYLHAVLVGEVGEDEILTLEVAEAAEFLCVDSAGLNDLLICLGQAVEELEVADQRHCVIDVVGQREVLLDLIELLIGDVCDGVLLCVNDLLRKGDVQLRECYGSRVCTECGEGLHVVVILHGAQLNALEVGDAVDSGDVAGDLAHAVSM